MELDKRCNKCLLWKPIINFGKCKKSKDGLKSICKDCKSIDLRIYRDKVGKEVLRDSRLRCKYGITDGTYKKLLEFQNYGCAICKRPTPNGRWDRLYVDHDHSTGEVRGLLCHPCNWAVGFVECEKLEKALDYLANHPFKAFVTSVGEESVFG